MHLLPTYPIYDTASISHFLHSEAMELLNFKKHMITAEEGSMRVRVHLQCLMAYCQPQAKAEAEAMPGRLYIHTKGSLHEKKTEIVWFFTPLCEVWYNFRFFPGKKLETA